MESRDPGDQQLSAFLRAMARASFAWGACDCALVMADWCRVRRGVDPAARLRGRYRTALGALRTVRRRGGFETVVRALMAESGFATIESPRTGDVGLVAHPRVGPACAIRCPLGWAVKSPAGLALGPWPARVAWRV